MAGRELSRGRSGTRLRALVGAILATTLGVANADAHLVTTGLGPVYDGIGHFMLTPEDVLPVIALALLAGLRGPATSRSTLWVLPLAWLLGGLLGARFPDAPEFAGAGTTLLLFGVLVAADARIPLWGTAALATALGLLHGFFNGVALHPGGAAGLGLLGIATTLFVMLCLVTAAVVSLRPPWTRIVVRVVGSWIAASGLLILGWALRPVA